MPIKQRTIDYVQDTRLLVARAREFERRGAAEEALVAYDMAAALVAGLPPGAFHADLYRWKGTLLRDLGETASAACLLKRSLDIAHYVHYADGVAHAQHALASVHLRRGDVATARQLYGDASSNAEAASDQRLYALVEQSLGAIAEIQGDLEGARIRYHMSLRTLRATGDDEGMSWALHRIGLLHIETGRLGEAAQAFEQAGELAAARGDRLMEARLTLARAALQLAAGTLDEADNEHARAMTMTERRHERPLRTEALLIGARVRAARGKLEQAVSALEEARVLAERSDDVVALARVLAELGDVCVESGAPLRARESWLGALTGYTKLGATREVERLQQRLSAASGVHGER
jgi:tetratricopeptide (TPR) repeat protein